MKRLLIIPLLATAANAAPVEFSTHIAPIIFRNCAVCHRVGEAAPFTLTSYDDVKKRAKLIAKVTHDRVMPPWHADKSDFAFLDDRRLTPQQIDLIQQWVAQGTPEGDRAKQPALPKFPQGWQLGKPDMIVKMTHAYSVPAEGRDIYRNFIVPLNLNEDIYVKAVEFRPSSPSVVHHSLFFWDTTGAARRSANASGITRFTPMQRENKGTGQLGGWALGATVRLLPEDLAFLVPKGADLILATHFHPSGKAEEETSTIGLYLTKEPPKRAFTGIQLPPAFGALAGVDIPAGEKEFTVTDSFVLTSDAEAFGISGHAHYLGKKLSMTALFPDGSKKNLVSINDWDFAWQEQYTFDKKIPLPKGTRLDARVTWDNSATNPHNPTNPPKRIRWGPQSEDEMGSLTLLVTAPDKSNIEEINRAQVQHVRDAGSAAIARLLQDRNGGGTLVSVFFKNNDKNGNGKIEREEAPRWLVASFDQHDTNKDGALDEKEIQAAQAKLFQGLRVP